jgi:hypothetical protein
VIIAVVVVGVMFDRRSGVPAILDGDGILVDVQTEIMDDVIHGFLVLSCCC